MSIIEVKVPDIGDYKNIPVIEVLVKPGDGRRLFLRGEIDEDPRQIEKACEPRGHENDVKRLDPEHCRMCLVERCG